jgi:hypothetical protein
VENNSHSAQYIVKTKRCAVAALLAGSAYVGVELELMMALGMRDNSIQKPGFQYPYLENRVLRSPTVPASLPSNAELLPPAANLSGRL